MHKGTPKETMRTSCCFKANLLSFEGTFCVLSLAKLKPSKAFRRKGCITYIRWDQQRALQASKPLEAWKTEETKSETWANSSLIRGTRAHAGIFFFKLRLLNI